MRGHRLVVVAGHEGALVEVRAEAQRGLDGLVAQTISEAEDRDSKDMEVSAA